MLITNVPTGKSPMLSRYVPSGKTPRQRSPTTRPTHQRIRDPRPPPRPTHRTSNAVIRAASPPRSLARALEAEDRDPRGRDLNRPGGGYEASRHRDFLHAVDVIGDDAAPDRAADLLTPKLLAGVGVERIEVAAHIAKEYQASGSRRHAACDRVIGFDPPFPNAGVGVDGVEPSRPVSVRPRLLPEQVERIERPLTGPKLPGRRRDDFLVCLQLHRGAPVDVTSEDQIGPG